MLELKTLAHILIRRWYLFLLIPILAVGLILWIASRATPIYQSDVSLLIHADKTVLEGRDLIYGYYSLDQASIVATFVELANSRKVFAETVSALNINSDLASLVKLNTVALPTSAVLQITAKGPDPVLAQMVAQTAGDKLIELVKQYYNGFTIEIIDPAYVPRQPVSPNPIRNSAVAIVLGLALAGGLAFVDYFLSEAVKNTRRAKVYDPSSSAYTRAYMERHLKELEEAKNLDGCLAIISLNGLKGVKGKMSQAMYDRLLHYVVKKITGELRGKDLVGRWNDTGFSIYMPKVSTNEAVRLLESVQLALEQPQRFPDGGPWIYFDPRIGGVTSGPEYQPSSMIQEAEAALAKAGMNGAKPVISTALTPQLREAS